MPAPCTPLNKSAQDLLRDRIFHSNGFLVPKTGMLYGVPKAVTPLPADVYERDTVIRVSVDPTVPFQRYRGEKCFLYKRTDLSTLTAVSSTPTPIAVASYPTTTYALLVQINAYYGLQLTEDDVQDITYASSLSPIMAATTTSLNYTGNLTLNLTGTSSVSSDGVSASDGVTA
ncbi:hypothetical protein [Paraburkholderia sp. BCC1886]|uniref:DUF7941 domain-family protein n=1 Tax=Paraburkholderia sp. BCC1886 TaxID=2562670 RepID=UPI001182244D|nr:hypothetical protein [Paraburkholderia sp. BCC1886]